MAEALKGVPASEFHEPEIVGEVISHRPPAPPPAPAFEFEWPVVEFPPCFPFCGAGDRDIRDLLREQRDLERENRRRLRDAERLLED